ncbi:ABC transporter ATP-binding protein [Reichenbachiella versicolor]|uniref:ABC transporter ATP-binding protein n=1 Tax=Reichenbachiella versicolor TaxID=1821036 RepID=UPI000D6E32C8|nr:ATP-binding cassette domain-containing protein [Reichenbachiella versicolor]
MSGFLITTLRRTYKLLSKEMRSRIYVVTSLSLLNSFFDLFGLAAVLPILAASLKKRMIHENPFLDFLFRNFHFTSEVKFLFFLSLILILVVVAKNIIGLYIYKRQVAFSLEVYQDLSNRALDSIYKKGYGYLKRNNSNKLLNKVVVVPHQFAQLLLIQLFQLINEALILLLILVAIAIYDFKILLILFVAVVPSFYFFYVSNKKQLSVFNERLNELGPEIAKPVFEIIFGYVDVVVTNTFSFFKKNHFLGINEGKELRTKLNVLQQIPQRLVETSVIITVVTVLLYGVVALESSVDLVALLGVLGLAAYRSLPSINRMTMSLVHIKGQAFNLDVLEEIIEPNERSESIVDVSFENRVTLESLNFKFSDSDRFLFSGVNLEIEKGETVGLIGKSGSGKSTIINLILGFVKPSSGRVLIDGIELDGSNIDSWRKKIGYVKQDVFIVDGTLAQNIAFGLPDDQIDYDRLSDSIQRAQLFELVTELPQGIDTEIGERGSKLSGGQRQRVAIARALYHEAKLLLFDEATSALDSETEREITEAIEKLSDGSLTMLVIAHRHSTLKYCNKIYSLDNEELNLFSTNDISK